MGHFEPSKELREKILHSIAHEERKRAKKYVLVSSIVLAASVAGFGMSITWIMQVISKTSFYQYVSLIFSDFDMVMIYWKEFAFSLIESIPFFELTFMLIALVALMIAIRIFINNTGRKFTFSTQ